MNDFYEGVAAEKLYEEMLLKEEQLLDKDQCENGWLPLGRETDKMYPGDELEVPMLVPSEYIPCWQCNSIVMGVIE